MRIALVVAPFISVPPVDYGGTELFVASRRRTSKRRRGGHCVCQRRVQRECGAPLDVCPSQWPIKVPEHAWIRELNHESWSIMPKRIATRFACGPLRHWHSLASSAAPLFSLCTVRMSRNSASSMPPTLKPTMSVSAMPSVPRNPCPGCEPFTTALIPVSSLCRAQTAVPQLYWQNCSYQGHSPCHRGCQAYRDPSEDRRRSATYVP
jgi:hypothetical protein